MWALAVAHAAPVVDVAHHPCSMLSHGRVANVPPCAFVLVAVCPPRLLWYSPSRSGGVLTVAVFAHAAVAVLQVGRAGFFPRNRCNNGYDCDFCHYEHEKRKRKNKKSKKKNKEGVRGGGGAGCVNLCSPVVVRVGDMVWSFLGRIVLVDVSVATLAQVRNRFAQAPCQTREGAPAPTFSLLDGWGARAQ